MIGSDVPKPVFTLFCIYAAIKACAILIWGCNLSGIRVSTKDFGNINQYILQYMIIGIVYMLLYYNIYDGPDPFLGCASPCGTADHTPYAQLHWVSLLGTGPVHCWATDREITDPEKVARKK